MSSTSGRRASRVPEIRDQIRNSILQGELAPDTPLSSVQLAKRFDVSRTPLREALRLLQEEGLVTMTDNHRARVAINSPDDLDAVYAQRILLSALCTSLSVREFTATHVKKMHKTHEQLVAAYEAGNLKAWQKANQKFHDTHMSKAPEALASEVSRLQQRCRYFFTVWAAHHPNEQHLTIADHENILDACTQESPQGAAEGMARHLYRVGATLYNTVSGNQTPIAMSTALAQVAQGDDQK